MTMDDMELAVERWKGDADDPAIAEMLGRMKFVNPTAKTWPESVMQSGRSSRRVTPGLVAHGLCPNP